MLKLHQKRIAQDAKSKTASRALCTIWYSTLGSELRGTKTQLGQMLILKTFATATIAAGNAL